MRRAFTLIEILVVIAVVAVLIGILLPSLAGAREASRRTVCLARQREIGLASNAYAADARDYVPREGARPSRAADPITNPAWPAVLRPYVDGTVADGYRVGDLFAGAWYYRCPSRVVPDSHNVHFMINAVPFVGPGEIDPRSNPWESHLWRRPPMRLSTLPRPGATLMLAEYIDDQLNRQVGNLYATAPDDFTVAQYYDVWYAPHLTAPPATGSATTALRIAHRRHAKTGSNALFFDGHAAGVAEEQTRDLAIWDDGVRAILRRPR